jgi:hypothetical protein
MFYKLVGLTTAQDIKSPTELDKNLKPVVLVKRGEKITHDLVDKMIKNFVYEVRVRLVPFDKETEKKAGKGKAIKRQLGKRRFLKLHG